MSKMGKKTKENKLLSLFINNEEFFFVLLLLFVVISFIFVLDPLHLTNAKVDGECCNYFCKSKGLVCSSFSAEYIFCVVPETQAEKGWTRVYDFYVYDAEKTCDTL